MTLKDKKILVIDDEDIWIKKISTILKSQGYRFIDAKKEVTNFDELVGYDLAILDIEMKKYDGLQIKRYLEVNSPETKIMFISGRKFGLNLLSRIGGADGWMEKDELVENDVEFIILVEKIITDSAFQNSHSDGKLTEDITPAPETKTTDRLMGLRKLISESQVHNKSDLLLDLDQLNSELSKKEKDDTFIKQKFEKVYNALNLDIEPIKTVLFKNNSHLGHFGINPETENVSGNDRGSQNINVNPRIYINSSSNPAITFNLEGEKEQLLKYFSEIKEIILKELPQKSDEMQILEKGLHSINNEDINTENRSAVAKMLDFIKQIGDKKSEISKIVAGTRKGAQLVVNFVKSFDRIAKYLQIVNLIS